MSDECFLELWPGQEPLSDHMGQVQRRGPLIRLPDGANHEAEYLGGVPIVKGSEVRA